jgi:nicotinamidase-related amidase
MEATVGSRERVRFGPVSKGCRCAVTNDWKAQTPIGQEKAMLYNKHVPISESALLVIDAQDSFKLGDRWVRRNNKDFETNVGRLVELYRRHRLPVIYFLHSDDDPGFERHSKHYKLMDFLAPLASEPVLHKDTRNVFTSTGLPALLMEKGVRRVVITGIQMEQCCETSARVAADLGYAVDFVTEATMTFPIPNHDKPGEELDVDAIRERTEYALRRRFATIATVDSIARELGLAEPSSVPGTK